MENVISLSYTEISLRFTEKFYDLLKDIFTSLCLRERLLVLIFSLNSWLIIIIRAYVCIDFLLSERLLSTYSSLVSNLNCGKISLVSMLIQEHLKKMWLKFYFCKENKLEGIHYINFITLHVIILTGNVCRYWLLCD